MLYYFNLDNKPTNYNMKKGNRKRKGEEKKKKTGKLAETTSSENRQNWKRKEGGKALT